MPTQRLHAWLDAGTPVPGPPGLPRVIRDEGVDLPVRSVIDMTGAGVTATDDAAGDRTVITIPGLTPWTQNVDAALYDLNSVGVVRFGPYTGAPGPDTGIGNEAGTLHILTDNGGSINLESFGNGRVMVSTDGTRRLVVHQGGNVGIGPSMNPAYTLDVQGDVNSSGVYRVNGQPHTHAYADLTGKPSSFPPAAHTHPWGEITSIPSNVSNAVANTTQVIAGTGLTGGGALSGNVTLSANIAAIQTPWAQDIDGNGKALNYPKQVTIRANPLNAAGTDLYTGLVLDRTYGDTGDAMGIVWPLRAQIACVVTGTGESSLVFGAQTGSGDGSSSEVMRIQGAGRVGINVTAPGAALHVTGNPPAIRISSAAWTTEYFDIYRDAGSGNLIFNAAQPTYGGYIFRTESQERLKLLAAGGIQMWLGGSLKTLSVDGSGFVKAA